MVAVSHKRLIEGNGTPELAWQSWLQSGEIKGCTLQSYLQPGVRLVVVAPHPDDEVLACGGLIAMHRAQGGDISVIAVTDGEASHSDSPLWHTQNLGATRCAERIAGLRHLGLTDVALTRLAIPDGRVSQLTQCLSLRLQGLFRPEDVVVTTWRLDGHPDHDATGFAASLACSAVGSRLFEAPVWMWHWATPRDPLVPWQRLQRLPLTAQALDRKKNALSAHVSQLDESSREGGAVLGASIVQRVNRLEEYFFTAQERPHEAHRRIL